MDGEGDWSIAENKRKTKRCPTNSESKSFTAAQAKTGPPRELPTREARDMGFGNRADNKTTLRSRGGVGVPRKELSRPNNRNSDFKSEFTRQYRSEPNENRSTRRNELLGDRNITVGIRARSDHEDILKWAEKLKQPSNTKEFVINRNDMVAHRSKMGTIEPIKGVPTATDGTFLGFTTPEELASIPAFPASKYDMDIPAEISKIYDDGANLTFNRGSKYGSNIEEVNELNQEDQAYLMDVISRRKAKQSGNSTKSRERRLQGLLNKLTESNFDSILTKVGSDEGITSAEDLSFFLTLTFEKAAHMPNFLDLYARLLLSLQQPVASKDILTMTGTKKVKGAKEVYASVVTRTACEVYNNFMEDVIQDDSIDAMGNLEAANTRKAQRRGLAVFLSELVASQLLQHRILQSVLDDIIRNNDVKNIEFLICMCQSLFKKDSSEYSEKLKPCLEEYAKTLKEIGRTDGIDFRLRCLIEEQIAEWAKRI